MKLPPLTALRSFEAVVRLGSFAGAADELNVTQSAVSHQVRQLETWFGFNLFERSGRKAHPSDAGKDLAGAVSGAFTDIARASRLVARHHDRHTLNVAVIPSVATCWLIPRLQDFLDRHAGIGIRLTYAIHGSAVDFSDADVAIRYGDDHWPGFSATRLFEAASVPVASRHYLEGHKVPVTTDSLKQADLLHDEDRSGWQKWFRAAGLATHQLPAGPVFGDFALLRAAVLAGHGVALCPPSLIGDELASGALQVLFDIPIHADRGYFILEPVDAPRASAPARSWFKSWLLEQAGGPYDA